MTDDLFNSIEIRYAGASRDGGVRDLDPAETLRIVYRDGDLHLYVVREGRIAEDGPAMELHVLHTKITVLSQRQITFEGFAVPDRPGLAHPRVTVTLRHRGDLSDHAERLAELSRSGGSGTVGGAESTGTAAPTTVPTVHGSLTRVTAAGGVPGLELSYQWQRSAEEPPVRGTVFVDAGYLDRYARTDAATGEPLPVRDPDTVRRLAMCHHRLATPASAGEPEVLRRTKEFTEMWNVLFAPLPGQVAIPR